MFKKIIFLLLIFISISFGQYGYWGQYLLEKGYDENNNFLMPHRTLTMQMEGIGEEMIGLFSDTLANMSFNPALLAKINRSSFYIDFANQKPIEPTYSYFYPCFDYSANSSFSPPYYQRINKQEISPLLRSIAVYQPKSLPLTFGLSYELINYTGHYFENYSTSSYRYGFDAFGETMADGAYQSPEIRQAGDDTKSKIAHMVDFYTAWELSSFFSSGLKLSYYSDKIDGDYRNFNRHDADINNTYENYYDNDESRSNKINQYEITTGINYHNNETSIGLSGGWITGSDKQYREKTDSSYYFFNHENNFNRNDNSTKHSESWNHTGNTGFLSLNGSQKIDQFYLLYRLEYLKNITEIKNNRIALDTSNYEYSHYYSEYYYSNSFSGNSEVRIGNGELNQTKKTIGFALQANQGKNNFSFGIIFQELFKDKNVIENSIRDLNSKGYSTVNTISRWLIQEENCDINFTGSEKITQIKIPVSVLMQSKKGWRLRTTLTKIIGNREAEEEILIKYNDYLYHDLTQDPVSENRSHKNELYLSTPVKESIDRIQFRAYIECDFSENITISVLFNNVFISRGDEYRYDYYNDDSILFNVGNWKFGVGFKF